MPEVIDLEPFTKTKDGIAVRNLAFFDFGRAVREEVKLDEVDQQKEPCLIKIPERITYIANDFLDGLLGPSSDVFESPKAFFEHYQFENSELVTEDIKRTVNIFYYNKEKRRRAS